MGGVVFAIVLFLVTLGLLMAVRSAPRQAAASTAVLNIIPAPTATLPAPMTPPTATASPQVLTSTPPPPRTLAVGAYVQVTTGGDGLRLRSAPGLSGEVLFLAFEAEVYQIIDGPRQADGYTWWYLVDPYDQTPQGWAVGDFLVVIQNP